MGYVNQADAQNRYARLAQEQQMRAAGHARQDAQNRYARLLQDLQMRASGSARHSGGMAGAYAPPTFGDLLDRLLYAERMVSQAESEVSERHIALEDAQIAVRSSVTGLFIGRKLLALDSAKDRLAQAERVLEARRADRASAREEVEKMANTQQPLARASNIL